VAILPAITVINGPVLDADIAEYFQEKEFSTKK
jgi:hypothetical protein